jgi:hypothetical protein
MEETFSERHKRIKFKLTFSSIMNVLGAGISSFLPDILMAMRERSEESEKNQILGREKSFIGVFFSSHTLALFKKKLSSFKPFPSDR